MKNKKILLLVLITISLFSLTSCGKKENSSKVDEINIGYFNNITHAQALLMKQNKTLEDKLGKDVSVNWHSFNAGPAEVEALFSGDIDIGYIGPVPAVTANVKSHGDVVILSGATQGGSVLISRKNADIKDIKDLANKKVAIPQLGNTQHLILLKLLADNNLSPVTEGGNVNVAAVANADVENMMNRGDIDAALVPEPWGTTLLSKGANLVLDYDKVCSDASYDVAVVVVRKEFMNKNPELVDAFLEEHTNATATINNSLESSLEKINTEINSATGKSLEKSVIEQSFSRINVGTKYNTKSIMDFANISKQQKFINELPDEKSLFSSK